MKGSHRSAHAVIWTILGIALPLAFVAALVIRQTAPADRPAILLEAPTEENAETGESGG